MRATLIALTLALFAAGCTTIIDIPPGEPGPDGEPSTIMLSEMSAELGWTYETGPGAYDYTSRSPQGDQVIFRIGSDHVNINGTRWRQERDSFEKGGRDLLLPESTFNFVCKHFGRHELVRAPLRRPAAEYTLERITPEGTPAETAGNVKVEGNKLKGLTICIDAGHGGKDPGGIGHGVQEKGLCLNVALKLRDLCLAQGASVIMTRTGDTYPELEDRCIVANKGKADLFVSIHANIAPNDDSVTGIEAFYNRNSEPGARFAKSLVDALDAATDTPNRGAKKDPRELRVLEKTKMTAVLVELGFLSNAAEAKLLDTPDYQTKLAGALYDGVAKHWSTSKASVSK